MTLHPTAFQRITAESNHPHFMVPNDRAKIIEKNYLYEGTTGKLDNKPAYADQFERMFI
ncbi:MAG: hypothetical protein QCH99_00330 [Candidatus Bathyarchaeota archaeon]|nr:hypothetical protein [Candidatus Bathyarchaeum tardum]